MELNILNKYQTQSTKVFLEQMGVEKVKLAQFLQEIEELCLWHGQFFDTRTGENSHSHSIKFGCYVPGQKGDWAFSIELRPKGWFVTIPCNGRNGVTDTMFTKSEIPNPINSTNHTKVESENFKQILIWIDEGLKQYALYSISKRLPFFPPANPKSL